MTKASFWTEESGRDLEFWMQVDGHAAFADKNDPVCAACSILSQGLVAALFKEGFDVHYSVNEGGPDIQMYCKTRDSLEAERVEYMIKTCKHSFEMLAKNYPQNVSVSGEMPKRH